MDIAVLITNTDDSALSRSHPDDGKAFAALLAEVRPDWRCVPYWVCKGEWPADLTNHGGVLITGSPASVSDDLPWIAPLKDMVRATLARRQPLFGACFGHQLIAASLGARIIRNPAGWGHGLLTISRSATAPWSGPEPGFALYGSHIEQVHDLPAGARRLFHGPDLPLAGLAIGDHAFTIQHHPEMTHGFICDLVEEYADIAGAKVTAAARTSLTRQANRRGFARELARFFEHAATQRLQGPKRHGHARYGV